MNPKPFIEWPDMANLSDRQLAMLCLYEIIELKSEVRAISNLLLTAHKTSVSSEEFSKMTDSAQDAAIAEMVEHAKIVRQPGQRPGAN